MQQNNFTPTGFPSPAADYMKGRIDLNEVLIQHPAATFFVRAQCKDMDKAHIVPGSLLIVDKSITAKHNFIVVAFVDGSFTIKRLLSNGLKKVLAPDSSNPEFQPVIINEFTECVIWGVVTKIINDPT